MPCICKLKLTLILAFLLGLTRAQTPMLDSLKLEFKNSKNDSTRCFTLYFIVESEYNIDVWPVYNEELGKIALKNYRQGPLSSKRYYLFYYAMYLSNKGYLHMTNGNFNKAIEFYNKSLVIQQAIGDIEVTSTAYTNIGYALRQQGNIVKAIDYYYKALEIQERFGDKKSSSVSYNNIGFVYNMLGEYEKALVWYRKAEKIYSEVEEKDGLAVCLGNIARILYTHGDVENKKGNSNYKPDGVKKGIQYLRRAIVLQNEIKDYSKLAGSMNTLGGVLENYGDPNCTESKDICSDLSKKEALNLYRDALKLRVEIRDTFGLAQSYHSLAATFVKEGKLNDAFVYASRSLNIGKRFGIPERITDASDLLRSIYLKQGKYKEAYEMYALHVQMRDSINNESTRKASIKKQYQVEYEKAAARDSIANFSKMKEEQLKHEQAITQQRTYTYGGFAGLALMLVVAVVSFRAFKNKQKANVIITTQKHFIEEKQKEIVDSINYAKRIQNAHLPQEKYISKKLKELMDKTS